MAQDKEEQETKSVDQSQKSAIDIPAEKAYYLHKIAILEEVKSDLIAWAKGRFWTGSIILAVVGFLGGYVLIKATLRELVEREMQKISTVTLVATESAIKAKVATEEVIKQAETYSKTVSSLQEEAKKNQAQLVDMRQKLMAETGTVQARATREVKEVTDRVVGLEKLVTDLAKESQRSQQALAAYQKEVERLKTSAASEARRFTENANYRVTLYYNSEVLSLAKQVAERLTKEGFKAALFGGDIKGLQIDLTKRFTANTILYAVGAEAKAKEIADLLRPIVQIKQIQETKFVGILPFTIPFKFEFEPVFQPEGENRISILLPKL